MTWARRLSKRAGSSRKMMLKQDKSINNIKINQGWRAAPDLVVVHALDAHVVLPGKSVKGMLVL